MKRWLGMMLYTVVSCGGDGPGEPPASAAADVSRPSVSRPSVSRPHVIWISLDTTRADALGAWAEETHWGLDLPTEQRPVPVTPVLDRLAASGVRFARAFAPAPTTLSSHTSAFSGLDSHGHRVVRNGYPVPAEVSLLPEVLAEAGYDTRAVVGSSVLESKMGLSRGFASYVAPEPSAEGNALAYSWNAHTVTNRALEQVAAHDSSRGPLFLFAHYYDPHMPWTDAPDAVVQALGIPGYAGPVDGTMDSIARLGADHRAGRLDPVDRRQARARYLAEVAGVDSQLDRLFGALQAGGYLESALVVVMADHGETLDDSRVNPYSHGPDVALVDIHVPMMVVGMGSVGIPSGVVVDQPVGLIDLPATVYGLLALPGDPGVGVDLAPTWTGGTLPQRTLFAEATKPIRYEDAHRWNNLPMERSAIGPGPQTPLQLLVRPLAGGARELRAVTPAAPAVVQPDAATRAAAKQLLDDLTAWDASAPPHRDASYDAETHQALIELGYLDPDTPPPEASESVHRSKTATP